MPLPFSYWYFLTRYTVSMIEHQAMLDRYEQRNMNFIRMLVVFSTIRGDSAIIEVYFHATFFVTTLLIIRFPVQPPPLTVLRELHCYRSDPLVRSL